MFANIGDLTNNVISSEKNLPLKSFHRSHFSFDLVFLSPEYFSYVVHTYINCKKKTGIRDRKTTKNYK